MSVFSVVGVVAMALVVPRALKSMRAGDEDWRARWRALEPDRRRAIVRTMRRGQPVEEPEDAALALRAVAQLHRVSRAMRPVNLLGSAMVVGLLIIGLTSGAAAITIIAGSGLAAATTTGAIARQRRQSLSRSAQRTRQLHRSEP